MIWHKIDNKKPIAYKTGNWDGKKSDKLLVSTLNGDCHVAEMYEGFIDGTEFCDFYDINDFEIKNPMFWTEITDAPF